jgi:hypothetical protein
MRLSFHPSLGFIPLRVRRVCVCVCVCVCVEGREEQKAKVGLIARSIMPRMTSDYTLFLARRDATRSRYPAVETEVEMKLLVTDFFDVNGVFLQVKYRATLAKLLADFGNKNKDHAL